MKIKFCLALFAAVLCSCTVIHAQQSSSAAGAGAQADPAHVYGTALNSQENEIVAAADAMPADKYNFAPVNGNFKGVRSFGEQVKHIASANYHLLGGFGVAAPENAKSIDGLKTKEEIVKALKDSFAFEHRVIDSVTAQNAFQKTGEHGMTRAGMVTFALAHANDHYGQMVVYLRMNGIVPPASRH